jgi:hypothetical protein
VRWLGLWIGLAVVGFAVLAWGWWASRFHFIALRTRPMPGFEIDLPAGDVNAAGLDYRDGRLTIHGTASRAFAVQLNWGPGGLFQDQDVDALNSGMGAIADVEVRPLSPPTRSAIAGAAPTLSWAVRLGRMNSWMTQTVCGARWVMMMTGGTDARVEQLHRRIVASFRCRPDPKGEAALGDIPLAFDAGPGWFRLSRDIEELQLTDRRTILTARPVTRPAPPGDMASVVTAPGMMMPGLRVGERVADDWRVETASDDKPRRGWLTLRDCAGTSQVLILTCLTTGDDDGRRWLARARCRRPGEPRQTWPDPPGAGVAR